MNAGTVLTEAERFRELLGQRFGLVFEDARLGFLSDLLQRRCDATNSGVAAYLDALAGRPDHDELAAIASEVTVGETYFFRNREQFRALAEICLPERMRARGTDRRLRLLSAGCSSGEEPYTLAILLRETLADPSWSAAILGVDVNPAALVRAVSGRFSD